MIYPTVHLNGTSREDLTRQVKEAYHKIGEAIKALEAMAPHGRDYPQGEEILRIALEDHFARVNKVIEVQKDLVTIFEELIQ